MNSHRIRFHLFLICFLGFTLIAAQSLAQNVLPLHVDGKNIKDSEGRSVLLKSINFNHYMEYAYLPDTPENFHARLLWSHTAEDYQRIKKWGLNCVRLNISSAHIADDVAFDNLKNQVQYARQAGVYIIITYFAPPGSLSQDGYYTDKPFFDDIRNPDGTLNPNSQYFQTYLAHWQKISNQFKTEDHVLYELLNEPQLLSKWEDYGDDDASRILNSLSSTPSTKDETVYIQLMQSIINAIRSLEDNHIFLIDGLYYADARPVYFRFISELNHNANIVYSFHYYHPQDFVFQQCNWSLYRLYQHTHKAFIISDPGWTIVEFPFSIADFSRQVTNPVLQIESNNQSGAYYLKEVRILNQTDDILLFSDAFNAKTKNDDVNLSSACEGKLNESDPGKVWSTLSNNQWGSAVNSHVDIESVDGETVVSIADSVNKDPSKNAYGFTTCNGDERSDMLKEGNWAAIYLQNYSNSQNLINLEPNKIYLFKLVLKGAHLTNYGQLNISFLMPETHENIFTRSITRYPSEAPSSNINQQISSDIDMIDADISVLYKLSEVYNVPFYLGEFGAPERNLDLNDSIHYFRYLTRCCEKYGFGWSLFVYRAPFSNNQDACDGFGCGEYRTYGLYSGWGKTVSEMESLGLGTDINNSQDFYRRDFINAMVDIENIDLSDTIKILKALSGSSDDSLLWNIQNVDNNGKYGLKEAIYFLQVVSGYRKQYIGDKP